MTDHKKLAKVHRLARELGADEIKKSWRKNKKYVVLYDGDWIHFGDNRYDDFLDHTDKERRINYKKRASKIKDKSGRLTYRLKSSPNFWAYNVLW